MSSPSELLDETTGEGLGAPGDERHLRSADDDPFHLGRNPTTGTRSSGAPGTCPPCCPASGTAGRAPGRSGRRGATRSCVPSASPDGAGPGIAIADTSTAPRRARCGGQPLDVEQLVTARPQPLDERAERHLGRVREAVEHRFAKERPPQAHSVEATDERAVPPGLDGVREPLFVQAAVARGDLGVDPGAVAPPARRAGGDDLAERAVDAHLEPPAPHRPPQAARHVKPVERHDPAPHRREPVNAPLHRHGEEAGLEARSSVVAGIIRKHPFVRRGQRALRALRAAHRPRTALDVPAPTRPESPTTGRPRAARRRRRPRARRAAARPAPPRPGCRRGRRSCRRPGPRARRSTR